MLFGRGNVLVVEVSGSFLGIITFLVVLELFFLVVTYLLLLEPQELRNKSINKSKTSFFVSWFYVMFLKINSAVC